MNHTSRDQTDLDILDLMRDRSVEYFFTPNEPPASQLTVAFAKG